MSQTIEWNDFTKVDIRLGTIIDAQDFIEAIKPAYRLKIDLGNEMGLKQSSAQLTELYSKEELIGKQVLVVVNLSPKKIGSYISECLITGFYTDSKSVVLATSDKKIKNGLRLV